MFWSRSAASVLFVASVVATGRVAGQLIASQVGVATGATIPTGAYHAGALGGFNVGAQGMALVGFKLSGSPVGFRLDVTYGTNRANDQFKAIYQSSTGRPTDETSKLLGANVDLSYPVPSSSRLKPYLLGGIGVYHATISMTESLAPPADTSESTFAWNVGGGISYSMPSVVLFVEARFVDVTGGLGYSCPLATSCPRQPGPQSTFVPITAGVRFGGP
ncbi:MAG TPA: outer membrane beta-barrel protein [Gemmatimonadales bacterium]